MISLGRGRAVAVARLPGAQPAAVGAAQSVEQESAVLDGRLQPLLVASGRRGFAQSSQHEAVPLQQHLVVQTRRYAQVAGRQQMLPAQLHAGRPQQIAPQGAPQDVVALEVAGLGHPVPRHELGRVVAQHRGDLIGGPYVEPALLALGVGVEGGVEASAVMAQVTQHKADGLVQHLSEPGPAGQLPGVQVQPGEQGVVVQHLLEVGHDPLGVHRVAAEPAAQVVVDPA